MAKSRVEAVSVLTDVTFQPSQSSRQNGRFFEPSSLLDAVNATALTLRANPTPSIYPTDLTRLTTRSPPTHNTPE